MVGEGLTTLSIVKIVFSIDFFLQCHGLWFMISETIPEQMKKTSAIVPQQATRKHIKIMEKTIVEG